MEFIFIDIFYHMYGKKQKVEMAFVCKNNKTTQILLKELQWQIIHNSMKNPRSKIILIELTKSLCNFRILDGLATEFTLHTYVRGFI